MTTILFCRGFSKPNFNDTNVKTTASDPKFCADFKKVRFLIVGPTIVPENYDFVQAAVRQNTEKKEATTTLQRPTTAFKLEFCLALLKIVRCNRFFYNLFKTIIH